MDMETVITHLQIIHTWAEFARERDLQFFTAKHLEDIAQWADDALKLLKEQEAVNPIAKEDDTYECICGAVVGWDELDVSGMVQTRFNYCPFCGRPVKWE